MKFFERAVGPPSQCPRLINDTQTCNDQVLSWNAERTLFFESTSQFWIRNARMTVLIKFKHSEGHPKRATEKNHIIKKQRGNLSPHKTY